MKNLIWKKCYNVLVLIEHHQDLEKMILSVIRWTMDVQWNTKTSEEIIYTEKGGAYHLINKSAFIFYKISCNCVRQWCKTNGIIKRYNRLKRDRRKKRT